MTESMAWAAEQFGNVELGDRRRTARLVRVAASAAASPAGTVTGVFSNDAERQGAYDFLESEHITAEAIEKGVGETLAARCAREARILVPIDGSSLSFSDFYRKRDGLGTIGVNGKDGVGLKVMTALALDAQGVPIGPLKQAMWARVRKRPKSKRLPFEKRESARWLETMSSCIERVSGASATTQITFILDREADIDAVLCAAAKTTHSIVLRARNRVVRSEGGRSLRNLLGKQKVLGTYEVNLPVRQGVAARHAMIAISSLRVTLAIKDPNSSKRTDVTMSAIWARETTKCRRGEEPLDWLLLSNMQIDGLKDAKAVVAIYKLRWRIEEFHRTWKTGACNVEQSQLRTAHALQKWALVLAAVASRVERLKLLSRSTPDVSAELEFSEAELHALILLKQRSKKKTESIPDSVPTLKQATLWLAEFGGYVGKSSGGPPGSTTISRGLLKLRVAADAIAAFLAAEHTIR
jgi:hypothetical protein